MALPHSSISLSLPQISSRYISTAPSSVSTEAASVALPSSSYVTVVPAVSSTVFYPQHLNTNSSIWR